MPLNQGYRYTERLPLACEGEPLLLYLARTYPHSTEAEWRKRMEAGEVTLDGVTVGPDAKPQRGQELVWRRPPWEEPDVPRHYALLHEDAHVLAVDKPAGLPTLPGAGFLDNTLLARVREDYPDAAPLHRLGRWTSGIVLFALTDDARRTVARAWRENTVFKQYRALLTGVPEADDFEVTHPIGPVPHEALGSVHAATEDGRPSRSRFQILERRTTDREAAARRQVTAGEAAAGEPTALAEVVIVTGRPHQIRIHAAAAGYPLQGDPLYAPGGRPYPASRALPGDPGYRLHAHCLHVPHPADGRLLRCCSAPPPVLRCTTDG